MRIYYRLVLMFSVLIVVAVGIGGTIAINLGQRAIHDRISDQLNSVVVLKENQLGYFIDESVSDLKSVAADVSVNVPNDTLRDMFRKKVSADGDFIEFFLMDNDGKIVVSSDVLQEGKLKGNEEYFILGKKGVFVKAFYYSVMLKEPAITISLPVLDKAGNVFGVFAGRVNVSVVSRIMTDWSGMGKTGETYLVSRFNYAATDLKFEKNAVLNKAIYTNGAKLCFAVKENAHFMEDFDYGGRRVLGYYKWIPKYNACIVAEINRDEAFVSVIQLRKLAIMFMLAVIFGVLVMGYIFTRNITKPLSELAVWVRSLKHGGFSSECTVKSDDEVGELALAFEDMRKGILDRDLLLNSLLDGFKGKLGRVAVILMRRNVQKLVDENPRLIKIIPAELSKGIVVSGKNKSRNKG